jgi:hypothetical protein
VTKKPKQSQARLLLRESNLEKTKMTESSILIGYSPFIYSIDTRIIFILCPLRSPRFGRSAVDVDDGPFKRNTTTI